MSIYDHTSFDAFEDLPTAGAALSGPPVGITTGLVSGTRVETASGWKPVELIQPGEEVYVYDGTLQTAKQIERNFLGPNIRNRFPDGILMVPGGALDNCDAFYLLPDQHVLLESTLAYEASGNPFAVVPAAALEGVNGIIRVLPVDVTEAVTLLFEEEQLIYANSGSVVHCPSIGSSGMMPECTGQSASFQVLSFGQARALVALMANGSLSDAGDLAAVA